MSKKKSQKKATFGNRKKEVRECFLLHVLHAHNAVTLQKFSAGKMPNRILLKPIQENPCRKLIFYDVVNFSMYCLLHG